METIKFKAEELKKLWKPQKEQNKFDGGQVTIIGGSTLFHGAPLLALKTASRLVDMVFFASPETDKGVAEKLKAELSAFIWVPRSEAGYYISKADVALIGPGLMRYKSDVGIHFPWVCDSEGRKTKKITEDLLKEFAHKKWVIDGGSLQVIDKKIIPKGAVITPNKKEFEMLFQVTGDRLQVEGSQIVAEMARENKCVVALKGVTTIVSDGETTYEVEGGSAGLSKGGTGDIVAGLTAALCAKNEALLAAAAANFLVKKAGEELEAERGMMFNADDVAERLPVTWKKYTNQ